MDTDSIMERLERDEEEFLHLNHEEIMNLRGAEEEKEKREKEIQAMTTLLDSVKSALLAHLAPVTEKMYDKSNPTVDNILSKLEQRTGAKRENIAYGTVAFLVVYFAIGSLAQMVVNLVGFVYPAWRSIKAVRSQQKDDDTMWLIYWIVFACFSIVDFSGLSIIPFYWLAKAVFLLYLYLPHFKGANTIYISYIDPACTFIEGFFTPKPAVDNHKEE